MGRKKEFEGTVLSAKMEKTILVRIVRVTKHPKYSKVMKQISKFKVHDEKKAAKVGDIVRIRETRPLSKDKHFTLVGVVKKAETPRFEIKEEVK